MPSPLITVLLAEDHAIVRQGISAMLQIDGRFVIVGEARTGREAVGKARLLHPDVIVMDIAMPVLNGLEATRQVLAVTPTAKIVILSAHSDDAYVEKAIQCGAVGFVEKLSPGEILGQAITTVAAGNRFFSPAVARRLDALRNKSRHRPRGPMLFRERLSPREAEVIQLVAEGSANKQVATVLGISIKTVEKHRQHLMAKLDIHDTAGLTRYAIAAGIIEGNVRPTIV